MESNGGNTTNNTTEDEPFYEGKIINKRWVIDDRLGEGCCGIVFKVHDIKDSRRKAAMKVELKEENVEVLKNEVRVLRQLLDRNHVVQLIDCGKRRGYSYLVMTLFGRNLIELKRESELEHFTAGCVTRIGVQTLYAIKQIHEIGYVHRDVKPQNLVVGRRGRESRMIFLIDYGLARSFVVWTNNAHRVRKPRPCALLRGTTRYCSPDVHERKEQGRKDDLWSLLYLMVELSVGLPWVRKQEPETKAMKLNTSDETLLANCPKEWLQFLKHVRTLGYESRPDYKLLYDTLVAAMQRIGVTFADSYDWEKASAMAGYAKRSTSIKKSATEKRSVIDTTTKDTRSSMETGSMSDSSLTPTVYPNTLPDVFASNDLRL